MASVIMAIEVIKRGEPPDRKFEGTCRACGSEIRCDETDGSPTWDQREGGELMQIECPVCSKLMWVYR